MILFEFPNKDVHRISVKKRICASSLMQLMQIISFKGVSTSSRGFLENAEAILAGIDTERKSRH